MAEKIVTGNVARTATAANIQVIFNNSVVGFCTSIDWTINFNNRPINTIDSVLPVEFAPGLYAVTFSMSGLRMLGDSLEDMNIINAAGSHLEAEYMSIAVLERLNQKPLLNIQAGVINSIENSASSKGLMTFSISGTGFVALSGSNRGINPWDGIPQQILK